MHPVLIVYYSKEVLFCKHNKSRNNGKITLCVCVRAERQTDMSVMLSKDDSHICLQVTLVLFLEYPPLPLTSLVLITHICLPFSPRRISRVNCRSISMALCRLL